jgi:DNA-binding transcriptional LysR family regulator
MNMVHLKYAVEVARTRSISKAAENLYMGQPNLSRAIKELEETLGITIFERTSRGIRVTADGEEFLQYAKRIVAQVDEVEALYRGGRNDKQAFSICVPRCSYIAQALNNFARTLRTDLPAEIFYKETNSMRTLNNIVREEYNLGIVRYQTVFHPYFERMFEEKKLKSEQITEFSYLLLLSEDSPLAKQAEIQPEDLAPYIEITHADPYVPSLPLIDVKKAEMSEHVDKRIFVFERGSQFDLLSTVPTTFMWVSPVPQEFLQRYRLVQRRCNMREKRYRDVLIWREHYKRTPLDDTFVQFVREAEERVVQNCF